MHAKHELRYERNTHITFGEQSESKCNERGRTHYGRRRIRTERVKGVSTGGEDMGCDTAKQWAQQLNKKTELCNFYQYSNVYWISRHIFGHAFASLRYSHILMCERALHINKLPDSTFGALKFACFIFAIMYMLIHSIYAWIAIVNIWILFRWTSIANRIKCARICIWSIRP